ncbi:hypothetical protein FISHEDRAFT_33878 [Fistulina hepatica ATCC 64428]|uniref:N-acetyltransferase domain-containing protein n=1 Tax=Fistulina hepatica ATCC 64428 TaxID=1128425 RepID=A0A0D7AMQ1_9AGAR|nr:hypothetical protein FISHEDRAFT_33878 [Fistulina hepatica ATCC 64428]
MRLNERTIIIGQKVVLVPYGSEHVDRYHQWMLDEEIRELTASELLTIDEEWEMQRRWREDIDKLTFITLARISDPPEDISVVTPESEWITSLPMVGDVNLFLKNLPGTTSGPLVDGCGDDKLEAEVELMIAERAYRRKGLAMEATRLMLAYATNSPSLTQNEPLDDYYIQSPLPILPESLVVRVSETNDASVGLFQKLGFRIVKRVAVFQEVEMRWVRSGRC